jgi:hypothetical protein
VEFVGTGDPYTSHDVARCASLLSCETAAIRAVIDVESAGVGFGASLRPLILFEPHIFYRRLAIVSRNKLTKAVNAGLAYQRQGMKPYPKLQSSRYVQLEKAMRIDHDSALMSASWGIGQVMGFNFEIAGYGTVSAMVECMKISEGEQLLAMMNFIIGNRLDRYLRSKSWASFARGYNGSNYAAGRYDVKLSVAYQKYARLPRALPR